MAATIYNALWDTFEIEGRDAAYASQHTFEKWQIENPNVNPNDVNPSVLWNDGFRLGFLLGSGRVTLSEVGVQS